jgi:uncharacterized protein YlxW (UPF0749 family)
MTERQTDPQSPRQPGAPSGVGVSRVSTALLDQLLSDPLDPGYRAAASNGSARRWWDGPVVWLGCLAVGLVLMVAYQQSHRSAPAREVARRELVSRIHALQSAGNGMESTAKKLAAQVAALRDAQLTGSSDQVKSLEVSAGAVAVTGAGIDIQLADPPQATPSMGTGRPGTVPQVTPVLRDLDIRAVVNQLWASGAEAIAVNGVRLTATSAIRVAGESVLVDFLPIASPYTIAAIGDRDRLLVGFADSAIARSLKTKEAVNGISFKFSGKSVVRLPGVTVPQPRYAARGVATPVATSADAPSSGGPTPGRTMSTASESPH